jgi:hypothetical protein
LLKVFRVGSDGLQELAAARTTLRGGVGDLTLVEAESVVVMSTAAGLWGWWFQG